MTWRNQNYNYFNNDDTLYGGVEDNNYRNKLNNIFDLGTKTYKSYNQFQQTGKTPWGAIGSIAKQGYNTFTGKSPKDYSDTEQSVIYPLQGASAGAQFGPWGALGGALYGLGYSFKDDLGLKDSNFLTQMLFPIGMGDSGGLRVSGNSILDLG